MGRERGDGRDAAPPGEAELPDEGQHGEGGADFDPEALVEVPIEESLDLHFFRPGEVGEVVEAYLEAARERGFGEVRLIHGRGRGVQRARVQKLVARSEHVESWTSAPGDRGGWGATIARLKAPEREPD